MQQHANTFPSTSTAAWQHAGTCEHRSLIRQLNANPSQVVLPTMPLIAPRSLKARVCLGQGRIKPGMRVGFVLPTAGVTAIIGGLNVAHVNPDGCFKRVLPARPGR